MYQPPAAHRCGHPDRRPITVSTEAGSHQVCQLCGLQLMAEAGRRIEICLVITPLRVDADA